MNKNSKNSTVNSNKSKSIKKIKKRDLLTSVSLIVASLSALFTGGLFCTAKDQEKKQLRPYVNFVFKDFTLQKDKPFAIGFSLTCYGATPASNVKVFLDRLGNESNPDVFEGPQTAPSNLFPGDNSNRGRFQSKSNLTEKEIDDVQNGKTKMIFTGRITYTDLFEDVGESGFSFSFDPKNHLWIPATTGNYIR